METATTNLTSINLVVQDMARALSFYRTLGLTIEDGVEERPHVECEVASGVTLEFDTVALTRAYDPGWEPAGPGSRVIFGFGAATRQAVDDLWQTLVSAGYTSQLAPFDAFWGSRYATVRDPDGNLVGLASPRDETRTIRPPAL